MRVITLLTQEGKTRYMLLDHNNEPVRPVLQYLKFKDNSGASRNTLRSFTSQNIKYNMTDASKDALIAAKNSRIKKLEEENKLLKEELLKFRGLVYEKF